MFCAHILCCGTSLAHLNSSELQLGIPDSKPQVAAHVASTANLGEFYSVRKNIAAKKIPQGYPDATLPESYFI